MKISVELSMYPLNEDYKERIIQFVKSLRDDGSIRIETNGMSSQLYGEYDTLMKVLNEKIRPVFESNDKVVMVLKMVNDDLKGPIKF